MAAATNPATSSSSPPSTVSTAAHRGKPWLIGQDAAGSRPMARNRPNAISSSVCPAINSISTAPTATATPAAAAIPMKKADCQLKRRPIGPSGSMAVLIAAAASSAAAMGPSSAGSWGRPSSRW